jgi:heme-degrading monooxygenase HmoA
MYGTIARMRLKEGMEEQAQAYMQKYEDVEIPGSRAAYMFRMDADPREFYLVAVFDSKEAYVANANSPDQNARYEEMVSMLEGPPEWHDGEVLYSETSSE